MKVKLSLILSALFLFITPTFADLADEANKTLLPESFVVYTDGATVTNHPELGFSEQLLPTINLYKGTPGCYIACYSHQKQNAIYSVGDNIYVLGQIRIAGRYANNLCEPTNFAGKDISADTTFKTICSEKIQSCTGNNCWAGGDTGGWFGITTHA